MSVIGNKKQEEKITELARIANKLNPEVDIIIFKGIFRYGVGASLEKYNYTSWADVAKETSLLKRAFIKDVLLSCADRIERAVGREKKEELIKSLEMNNQIIISK